MKIEKLLRTAFQYEASDLYVGVGIKPILRINGNLVEVEQHPVITEEQAKEYLLETMNEEQLEKFHKNMDIDFGLEVPNLCRFRVNLHVRRKGLGGVFRVIPSKIKTMEELDLPESLTQLSNLNHGLVIVTGPTGSGKSTTLASIIDGINKRHKKHIITIEDPIEFVHQNDQSVIDQREIFTHTKSFKNGLKAALRSDADVVLLGEMRDLETIALAITAAETGHLVLTTLHTAGAANTISRIIDVFPTHQQEQIRTQLADILQAIIFQGLPQTADGKGRVGVFEILFNSHAVANMIRTNKTHQIESTMETSKSEGMQTLKTALEELVLSGKITQEEADKFLT